MSQSAHRNFDNCCLFVSSVYVISPICFAVPVGPLEMPQRTLEEDEEREMRNVSSPDVSFQIVNMYCHLNFE